MAAVVKILENNGQRASTAFQVAGTHQVVMGDQKLVVAWFEVESGEPDNAISIVTDDPMIAANEAITLLQKAGFSLDSIDDLGGGNLVRVRTNAFAAKTCLIFRKTLHKMPRPQEEQIPR